MKIDKINKKLDDILNIGNTSGDTTKKIKDFKLADTCNHPGHNPPMFRVYSPGVWEHTCPGCGHVTRFTVPLITV